MKKSYFLLVNLLCCMGTYSQCIIVNNPIKVKWPHADSTVTVDFFIKNPTDAKFKVRVADMYDGSAIPGEEYELATTSLSDITDKGSFNVKVKPSRDNKGKIVHLCIKASSDDTVLSAEMEIMLFNNLKTISLVDVTNTPKFEFVNYTDFKGFDPDQPNGVAQSQFLFKIPINKHCRLLNDGETRIQWFRSLILPNFLFNRIDKDSQALSLQPTYLRYGDSVAVSQIVNTFDFIKYSTFILNGKLAVLNVMTPKSRIQLQLNYSLYKVKVDSAQITDNTIDSASLTRKIGLNPIWATGYGLELFYETKFAEGEFPFNFRFILGGQTIKLNSSEYKQADVASITPDNNQKTAVLLDKANKHSAPIWNVSLMIKKNLGLKQKDSSEDHYLFFRFNYYWQNFKSNVLLSTNPVRTESKKFSNNFSQFQLGVDLSFDSFFK